MDETSQGSTIDCPSCGGVIKEQSVNVTYWTAKGLVVVEDVPARICADCHEQYYDDDTGSELTKLITAGFPKDRAVREITVPVFRLTRPGRE